MKQDSTLDVKVITDRCSLKKVQAFKGHDGIGLNCDVYFDGVKAFEYYDDASGGESNIDSRDCKGYTAFKEWLKTLPTYKYFGGNKYGLDPEQDWKIDEDTVVNELFDLMQEEKENKARRKKIERQMVNSIMIGTFDNMTVWKQKAPLSAYKVEDLQQFYDKTVKPRITGEIKLLNTNLESLGIKI